MEVDDGVKTKCAEALKKYIDAVEAGDAEKAFSLISQQDKDEGFTLEMMSVAIVDQKDLIGTARSYVLGDMFIDSENLADIDVEFFYNNGSFPTTMRLMSEGSEWKVFLDFCMPEA